MGGKGGGGGVTYADLMGNEQSRNIMKLGVQQMERDDPVQFAAAYGPNGYARSEYDALFPAEPVAAPAAEVPVVEEKKADPVVEEKKADPVVEEVKKTGDPIAAGTAVDQPTGDALAGAVLGAPKYWIGDTDNYRATNTGRGTGRIKTTGQV